MLEAITTFKAITLWKDLISNLLGVGVCVCDGVGVGVGVDDGDGDGDGDGPTMMIYLWR